MATKNSSKHEVRVRVPSQRIEIRTAKDGTKTITGYAAVFNSLSEDLNGFREKIQPGAFTESLRQNRDVQCLYAHDDAQLLGRTSSGTLTVTEDDKGLRFSCKLPNTSLGNDLAVLLQRGDLRAMSFGFQTVADDWQQTADGQLIRTLIQVDLFEVSIVGTPAYEATTVSLRSLPHEFRDKLRRDADDDDEDDDDDTDDPDTCGCDCAACTDGNCDDCDDDDCDDEDCRNCPMQDEQRADRLRLASHFESRRRLHCN